MEQMGLANVIRIRKRPLPEPLFTLQTTLVNYLAIPMLLILHHKEITLVPSPFGPILKSNIILHASVRSIHKQNDGLKVNTIRKIKRKLFEIGEWLATKAATTVIIPSAGLAEEIIKEYNVSSKKVKVVAQGIDKNVFKPAKEEPMKTYLFAPSILRSKLKGGWFLVDVVKKYVQEHSKDNLRLVIVKPNVETEYSKAITKELRKLLGKHLIIVPRLPAETLAKVYYHAAAVLYPSEYEGYGRIPLECAAAGGIPITGNNIPVAKDIEKIGGIVLDRDPELWAKEIHRILFNQKHAQEIRNKIMRNRVLIKTWEDVAKEIYAAVVRS